MKTESIISVCIIVILLSISFTGCSSDDDNDVPKEENNNDVKPYYSGKIKFHKYFNMSQVTLVFDQNNITPLGTRLTDNNLILDYSFMYQYIKTNYNLSGYVVNYYENKDEILSYITVHYINESISEELGIEFITNATKYISEILIDEFSFLPFDESYGIVIPPHD